MHLTFSFSCFFTITILFLVASMLPANTVLPPHRYIEYHPSFLLLPVSEADKMGCEIALKDLLLPDDTIFAEILPASAHFPHRIDLKPATIYADQTAALLLPVLNTAANNFLLHFLPIWDHKTARMGILSLLVSEFSAPSFGIRIDMLSEKSMLYLHTFAEETLVLPEQSPFPAKLKQPTHFVKSTTSAFSPQYTSSIHSLFSSHAVATNFSGGRSTNVNTLSQLFLILFFNNG